MASNEIYDVRRTRNLKKPRSDEQIQRTAYTDPSSRPIFLAARPDDGTAFINLVHTTITVVSHYLPSILICVYRLANRAFPGMVHIEVTVAALECQRTSVCVCMYVRASLRKTVKTTSPQPMPLVPLFDKFGVFQTIKREGKTQMRRGAVTSIDLSPPLPYNPRNAVILVVGKSEKHYYPCFTTILVVALCFFVDPKTKETESDALLIKGRLGCNGAMEQCLILLHLAAYLAATVPYARRNAGNKEI
eukprot:scaffold2656_cov117-Amphora_coffeaeformis.AAC.5